MQPSDCNTVGLRDPKTGLNERGQSLPKEALLPATAPGQALASDGMTGINAGEVMKDNKLHKCGNVLS